MLIILRKKSSILVLRKNVLAAPNLVLKDADPLRMLHIAATLGSDLKQGGNRFRPKRICLVQ